MVIFLIVILISVLIYFHPKRLAKKEIKQWEESLELPEHRKNFKNLYMEVNGFALSKEARLTQDALEYLYGEIDFTSFIALLSLCRIQPKTHFLDLGSGTGKAVIACAMVFDVEQSMGIELFPSLHNAAKEVVTQLKENPRYEAQASKIVLIQGDFLLVPCFDATLVFVHATAFFSDYWVQISQYLEQMAPGTLVISTSKALKSDLFTIEHTTYMQMSWGAVVVYIQRKFDTL